MLRIGNLSVLKRRLILAFGLVLAIAVVLLAALPFLAARQIDIEAELRTAKALQVQIDAVRDRLVEQTEQIAARNVSTGRFGIEMDPAWQQKHLWSRTVPWSHIDALLLVDATGRVLQSVAAPGANIGELGPAVRAALRAPSMDRTVAGFIRAGDEVQLLAMTPLGQSERFVALVQALDLEFMAMLEVLGQVENVRVTHDIQLPGAQILNGPDEVPVAGLVWKRHSTIARMIDQALEFSLVVVVALALIAGLFIRNVNALFGIVGRYFGDMLRTESALAAQLDFLQTLIDSLPDPVSYKDVDGRYLGCNEAFCRWVGRPKEEIVGRKVGDLFAAATTESVLRRDARLLAESALAGTATQRDEAVFELQDGRLCEVISTRAAFRDGDGRLAGLVHAIVDISDLKRQQEELRLAKETADAAHEAKSSFLATMSHELRTPLNGIIGMVQVLEGSSLTKQQREFIRLIGSSGEWLLTILNDILDLSKVEAGRMELDCVDFEIRGVIDGLVGFLSASAERKGIAIESEVFPGVPEVVAGDPARLRQILLNILGNAVKFTERGKVRCEVRSLPSPKEAARLQFVISDTGIGIPSHAMKRLFEPFTQADSSVARKYGGSGLGLAICKKFVSAMGGFITVESSVGVGTSFRIVLDFLHAQQGVAARAEYVNPGPFSVLLAEDNEVNQLVARLLLERLGHSVVTAVNGLEVLKALEQQDFDVILMDIQMAEMDGVETTRRIRALGDPHRAAIPIIAVTANVAGDMKETFISAGMNGFLAKPFMEEELSAALSQVIGTVPADGVAEPPTRVAQAQSGPEDENLPVLLEEEVVAQLAGDLGPDMLGRLTRTFRQASESQIAAILSQAEVEDYPTVARMAHTLISSAGNLGMIALSDCARSLERAAERGDQAAVRSYSGDLTGLHAASLARLESYVSAPQLT